MNTNKIMGMLPDMAVFVLVVEAGSFSAAAEFLGMTPSAVSRQISRLEKALDVTLLERTTRKQTPTEEGVLAYEKCRTLVDCANEVSQIAERRQTVKGDIRLSAPKAYSKYILQPLILEFLAMYPETNIHFKVTDAFMNPQRDDIDLAFRLTDSVIEGLVSKPVHRIESIICAAPSFLEKHGIPQLPEDLLNFSCITVGEDNKDRQWTFAKDKQKSVVTVNGRYHNNHSEMRLAATEKEFGIGIFPSFVAAKALKEKRLIQVLPDWTLISKYQGDVCIQFSHNKFMPARLRVFIDFLSERLMNTN